MSMTIQSGGTNGDKMLVTKKGAGVITAAGRSACADAAREPGRAYTWCSEHRDIDAGDSVLAVTNDHGTMDLVIHSVSFGGATNSRYNVLVQTTTFTEAGTAATEQNLNSNSNTAAQVTAMYDETGNSGGTVVHAEYMLANTSVVRGPELWGGALRLAPGHAIIVDQVADVAGASATIVGYFELTDRTES